jgi:hypothetical protein
MLVAPLLVFFARSMPPQPIWGLLLWYALMGPFFYFTSRWLRQISRRVSAEEPAEQRRLIVDQLRKLGVVTGRYVGSAPPAPERMGS